MKIVIEIFLVVFCLSLLLSLFHYQKFVKSNREREYKTMEDNIKYGLTREFLDKLKNLYKPENELNSLRNISGILLDRLGNPSFPIPVEDIIRAMGFSLYSSTTLKPNISAIIALDKGMIDKFQNDKIVVANRNDTVPHQRFAIAHEIAHFIFDCEEDKEFYDTYNTDTEYSQYPSEKRANLFAAELMMPYSDFKAYIEKYKDEYSNDILLSKISEFFGVPKTSVAKRYLETNYKNLLKGTSYEEWMKNDCQ